MIAIDNAFLKIIKHFFWHFHYFQFFLNSCSFQESNMSLLTSKIKTNFRK